MTQLLPKRCAASPADAANVPLPVRQVPSALRPTGSCRAYTLVPSVKCNDKRLSIMRLAQAATFWRRSLLTLVALTAS